MQLASDAFPAKAARLYLQRAAPRPAIVAMRRQALHSWLRVRVGHALRRLRLVTPAFQVRPSRAPPAPPILRRPHRA